MSTQPGLGALAIQKLASTITASGLGMVTLPSGLKDVPTMLTVGKEKLHLGRYLTSKLRSHVGMTDEEVAAVKQDLTYDRQIEMLALLQDKVSSDPLSPITAKQVYREVNHQKLLSIEANYKIWQKKRSSL